MLTKSYWYAGLLLIGAQAAFASPPSVSSFPVPRPTPPSPIQSDIIRSTVEIVVIDELARTEAEAPPASQARAATRLAVARSLRPVARGQMQGASASGQPGVSSTTVPATAQSRTDFYTWRAGFIDRAVDQGFDRVFLNRTVGQVLPDPVVIERDRNQAEFSRALWDYLDSAVSDVRVATGRSRLAEHRADLARIEERYQVEAEIVVAVWGLESAYGAVRGSTNVLAAMASLAYEGRRAAFFEDQLLAALRILQNGDVSQRDLRGSWAGAMGHTQFMPTSYLEYAQDYDRDGRRDIWSDNPLDALASTANYLAEHGWTYGQPWGLEVRLPEGFDYRLAGEQERLGAAFWNAIGVRLVNGDPIPDHGPSSILLPAGAEGVALVVYNNFRVIETYNPADAYVIAIGHLSDRIEGGRPFSANWPRQDRALTYQERVEMQRLLQARGHYDGRLDGRVGPLTIAAIRAYQVREGLVPDGYASVDILNRLR